jgi:hypothetical protein
MAYLSKLFALEGGGGGGLQTGQIKSHCPSERRAEGNEIEARHGFARYFKIQLLIY